MTLRYQYRLIRFWAAGHVTTLKQMKERPAEVNWGNVRRLFIECGIGYKKVTSDHAILTYADFKTIPFQPPDEEENMPPTIGVISIIKAFLKQTEAVPKKYQHYLND